MEKKTVAVAQSRGDASTAGRKRRWAVSSSARRELRQILPRHVGPHAQSER